MSRQSSPRSSRSLVRLRSTRRHTSRCCAARGRAASAPGRTSRSSGAARAERRHAREASSASPTRRSLSEAAHRRDPRFLWAWLDRARVRHPHRGEARGSACRGASASCRGGGTQRLPRAVGPGRARLMIFSGDPSPVAARRSGVWWRSGRPARVFDRAAAIGRTLAAQSPHSLVVIKASCVRRVRSAPRRSARDRRFARPSRIPTRARASPRSSRNARRAGRRRPMDPADA